MKVINLLKYYENQITIDYFHKSYSRIYINKIIDNFIIFTYTNEFFNYLVICDFYVKDGKFLLEKTTNKNILNAIDKYNSQKNEIMLDIFIENNNNLYIFEIELNIFYKYNNFIIKDIDNDNVLFNCKLSRCESKYGEKYEFLFNSICYVLDKELGVIFILNKDNVHVKKIHVLYAEHINNDNNNKITLEKVHYITNNKYCYISSDNKAKCIYLHASKINLINCEMNNIFLSKKILEIKFDTESKFKYVNSLLLNNNRTIVIFYKIKNKYFSKYFYLTYNFKTKENNIFELENINNFCSICKINENCVLLQYGECYGYMKMIIISQKYNIKIMNKAYDLNFLW